VKNGAVGSKTVVGQHFQKYKVKNSRDVLKTGSVH